MPYIYIIVLLLTYSLSKSIDEENVVYHKHLGSNTIFVRRSAKLILLALTLIFVAGFRYNVGVDYWNYYVAFRYDFDECVQALFRYKEPGIKFLSFLSRKIYDNGIVLIFLSSLFTIGLYVYTMYKFSPILSSSIILYILMGEWQGSFNGVRQYLAAAILFAGHRFMFSKNLKSYFWVVIIASLFHTTAIVMLFPYFLLKRRFNHSQFFIMSAGAVLLLLSYSYIFNGISAYKNTAFDFSDTYMTNSVSIFRILVSCAPLLLYYFLCRKEKISEEQEFYLNGMLLNSMTMIATMNSTYLARIGIYTNAICLIGYPHLFIILKNKYRTVILERLVYILYTFFWWYSIAYNPSLNVFKWWF